MNAFDTQFKHRINATQDGEFFNLMDTVFPSLRRAAAMADLLEVAGEKLDACDLHPDTLFLYAQTIRLEIDDAMSLITAYDAFNNYKVAELLQGDKK